MVIRRTVIVGGVLALVAGLMVDHGGHFGPDAAPLTLLGLALGSALGLMTSVGPLVRAAGFLGGFVFAWLGFAIRAGLLPDIPAGRAVAAVMVVLAITIVSVISRARIPLATGLIGAAAMVGAYETSFTNNPTAFTSESVTAATTALLCVSIGFLLTVFLSEAVPPDRLDPDAQHFAAEVSQISVPSQRGPGHDEPIAAGPPARAGIESTEGPRS